MASNNSLNLEINVDRKLRGVLALVGRLNELADAVKVAREFEKLNTTLITLEGSATKAEESMRWIKDFTKSTPFQLQEVSQAFIRMKAFGIEPTEGALMTLRDTRSAMGVSILQGVEALRDAQTGEFERLKEFGIKSSKIGENVRFNYSTSSGEAKQVIIKNNKEIINSTLQSIWNESYAGRADRQSKTLNGLTSNIQDNITELQDSFIQQSGIFDLVKTSLGELGQSISGFNLDSEEMFELSKLIINAFSLFRNTINGLSTIFDVLGISRTGSFETISLSVDILKGNFDLFVETVKSLSPEVQNRVVKTITSLSKLEVNLLKITGQTQKALKLEQSIKESLARAEQQVTNRTERRAKITEDISKSTNDLENNRLNTIKRVNDRLAEGRRKRAEINDTSRLLLSKSVSRNKLQAKFNDLRTEQKTLISEVEKLGQDLVDGKIKQLVYDKQIQLLNNELVVNYDNQSQLQEVILKSKLANNDITKLQFDKELKILKAKNDQVTTEKNLNKEKQKAANVEEFKSFEKLLKSRQGFSKQINREIEDVKNKNLTELELLKKNFEIQLNDNTDFNKRIQEAKKDSNIASNIDLNKREELNHQNRLALEEKFQLEKTELIAEMEKERKEDLSNREKENEEFGSGVKSDLGIFQEEETEYGQFQGQIDALNKYHNDKLVLMAENGRSTEQILARDAERYKQIEEAKFNFGLDIRNKSLGDGLGLIKNFNRLGLIEGKKRAKRQQRVAIVQATIDTYKNATRAYGSMRSIPYVGPRLGRVARAGRIRSGLAQVQAIKSQRFHTGGFIDPSSGGQNGLRNDETSRILQTGEGVVSRRGMKELDKLNEGKGNEVSSNSETGDVNVVIVDNRQSREDYIQSRQGKNIIKEINGS